MKTLSLSLLLFLSVPLIASDLDTCGIVCEWKKQPEVPLPTLDHHLGKITACVSVFSVLSLCGVEKGTSAVITSGAAITFELIQYLFFNETLKHSLNDMVLFSFHYPLYFALKRKYVGSVVITINLSAIYLLLL